MYDSDIFKRESNLSLVGILFVFRETSNLPGFFFFFFPFFKMSSFVKRKVLH